MTPPAAPLHILLVDDSQAVREVLARMLMAMGHVVTPADSAERALRILAAGPSVDVVLTDYQMPGMNGMELAQEIRRRWPPVALGLISGTAEGLQFPLGLFQRVLTKPVTLHALRAALAAIAWEPSPGAE